MSSYEMFAWRDAGELAMMAAADFKMSAARDQFEVMSAEQKLRIEDACRSMIEDFLRRTDSQRPAVLRKIAKAAGDEAAAMFAVFAIVALVRVREVLELRDRYMYALAPGSGNRETCAAIYAFQQEVIQASGIEWPDDAFDDIDLDEEECGDEDGDPRRSPQVTEADAERVVAKLETMVAEQARRAREAVEVAREPLFAVHASPSKVFCLDPAGRLVRGTNEKFRPLFRCTMGTRSRDHALVTFMQSKPTDQELAKRIAGPQPKKPGSVVLGLPSSLKALIEPLAAARGDVYLRIETLAASDSRLPFTHWPERFLEDLEVELALVREPHITFKELESLTEGHASWLNLEYANPKGTPETQLGRREELESLCMRILALRGRWNGPMPVYTRHLEANVGFYCDREDALKEVTKLFNAVDSGRANALGFELASIADDVRRWIELPSLEDQDSLADRVLQLAFRDQFSPGASGSLAILVRMLGRGLPEMDLVDAVVLRRLQRPIPAAWIPVKSYYGTLMPPTDGLLAIFWCEVHSEGNRVQGFGGWPKRKSRLGSGGAGELEILVQPIFRQFDPPRARTTETWARQSQHWSGLLREYESSIEGLGGALRKADWVAQEGGKAARFAQVVVKARNAEAIEKVRIEWPRMAGTLNAALEEQFAAATLAARARFSTSLEGFLDPFVPAWGSRATLLLGQSWTEATS